MPSSTPELDKIKNARHRRFVLELAANGFKDQTNAAIKASYAKSSAHVTASNLMKREDIAAAIEEQKQRVLASIEAELEKGSEGIIRELAIIGGSCITDYLSFNNKSLTLKASEDINPLKLRAIKSVKIKNTNNGTDVELGLHDKHKGLDTLAKIKGLFSDVDTSVKVQLVITGRD